MRTGASNGTKKERLPVRTQSSAGGLIFRKNDFGFEVALVSVKGGTVWTLPKGLINKGESPREAALREVNEETGLKGEIIDDLGEITYWYVAKEKTPPEHIRYKKTVCFYLMEYLSGNTANHDYEVDECTWFPLEKAAEMVTYKGDKEMLEKAKDLLGQRI